MARPLKSKEHSAEQKMKAVEDSYLRRVVDVAAENGVKPKTIYDWRLIHGRPKIQSRLSKRAPNPRQSTKPSEFKSDVENVVNFLRVIREIAED